MKRTIILSVTCAILLLTTVGASLLASSYAKAGSSNIDPRVQMLSGTFADQNLPQDGSKVTLLSIPFSIPAQSKLEVASLEATSLINASGYARGDSTTCELDVDDVSFFSVTTLLPAQSDGFYIATSVGGTSTSTGIPPRNHTLAVKCQGYDSYGESISVHSLGTSVIIAG